MGQGSDGLDGSNVGWHPAWPRHFGWSADLPGCWQVSNRRQQEARQLVVTGFKRPIMVCLDAPSVSGDHLLCDDFRNVEEIGIIVPLGLCGVPSEVVGDPSMENLLFTYL
mmetsp:Transcript_37228/g.58178  ORF Transcript_37228/g.58178 Transcript_37228/m.58178 type:complete len:110 (-) Transcript_37228:175-504(-)